MMSNPYGEPGFGRARFSSPGPVIHLKSMVEKVQPRGKGWAFMLF